MNNKMQISSSQQQIPDLYSQNEHLKNKYKKCLHEIMQLLNINKTMKEHIDKCSYTQARATQLQELVSQFSLTIDLQKMEIVQLQSGKSQLLTRIAVLQKSIRESQRQRNQLSQSYKKLNMEEEKNKISRDEQQSQEAKTKLQQQLNLVRNQNQKLSKTLLKCKGFAAQKQILLGEIQSLKENIKDLNLKQCQQQQRFRNQTMVLQNEIKRIRQCETQKTRQLESKCLILQAQLDNFQNIEKYTQQSKQSQNDQQLLNSIRQQIQKLNDSFNASKNENSLLTKSKEEEEGVMKKIADLESQIQRYRLKFEHQAQKTQQLDKRIREFTKLQEKIKIVQLQRQDLYQKNHVLEAFMITQRHRVHCQVSLRIEQFQRKIHMLLGEDATTIHGLGGLQQILILKSYVKELSELLYSQKKKQDKIRNKYEQLKEKMKHNQHQNALKMLEYNKKMESYDILIQKLYGLLEQKFLQFSEQSKEKEVTVVISRYEQKMIRMTDEIIKLKHKNQTLQRLNQTTNRSKISQEDYKQLIDAKINLEADLLRFQVQNKQLMEENRKLRNQENQTNQIIKEKQSIITQISQELATYLQQLKIKRRKVDQLVLMNQSNEKQMRNLHQQLQKYIHTNNYLLNKYKDSDSLLEKIAGLQKEVSQMRSGSQFAYSQQANRMLEHLSQLQSKITLQTQQIQAYKQENTHLYSQLQSTKVHRQTMFIQHHNLESQLSAKLQQLERLRKQSQKAIKQSSRLQDENQMLLAQVKFLVLQKQKNNQKAAKQTIVQLDDLQNRGFTKSNKELKDLNTKILALRTENLAMKNELEEKQATINELKHQIYNKQLKMHKQKSRQSIFSSKSQTEKQSQSYQRLLVAFTLVSAQLNAISKSERNLQSQVQVYEDYIIQQKPEALEKARISLENKAIVGQNNLLQEDKRLSSQQKPRYLKLSLYQSLQIAKQPVSAVDSNWRSEYERRKEIDHPLGSNNNPNLFRTDNKMLYLQKNTHNQPQAGQNRYQSIKKQ